MDGYQKSNTQDKKLGKIRDHTVDKLKTLVKCHKVNTQTE